MSEHEADAGKSPGPPQHPSLEQLEAYLDNQLEPADARVVADHLEACARCVDALDDLAPPAVLPRASDAESPAFDARQMRRAVRRTLRQTAFNAAMLLVVGAVGLQLVSWLLVHPVLVNRGDRVSTSVIATLDLPVMTIPGAEIRSVSSNLGVFRRITEVDVERAVGAQLSRLGHYATRLGPLGISTLPGEPLDRHGPRLSEQPVDTSPVAFEPERLGDGTAVTVELLWDHATVTPETADAVAEAADDLALLWVGFRIPGGEAGDPSWRLGYGACARIGPWIEEAGSGGFSGDGGFRVFPPDETGARHALTELRRATANLAATGWLDNERYLDGALADVHSTADWLAANEPGVASVVITGPTHAVAAAVDAHTPDTTNLLEIDFDRGAPQPCG